ncbi:MAG: hypothetical protein QOK37_1125 [Thermoanaerobaculia bacterium]|jgi:hypothetical protein|nr:hypothetical protein [Thermoanaerobaculia bacterium]
MTTDTDDRVQRLEGEQRAFDSQLEDMMTDHEGEFVLFRKGKPVSFFPTYMEAYQAGLDRFGLDDVYIVSAVKRRDIHATSITWAAGAM